MDGTKLVLKDCGVHYGTKPGPCSKCAHHDEVRRKCVEQGVLYWTSAGFNAAITTRSEP